MEFKIDTKTAYTLISPVSGMLDANLSAGLLLQCTELAEKGSQNFIINFEHATTADNKAFESLLSLHEQCYENGRSLVFTGITDEVLQQMKQTQVHLSLNIAPTLQEAVDIVSMEILERDLFNEES